MFLSVLCAIAPSKKQAKCLSIAESIASHSGALGRSEKERSTTRHKHVDEILNHHVDQKSDTKAPFIGGSIIGKSMLVEVRTMNNAQRAIST